MKVLLTRKALNEVRTWGAYMSRAERDKKLLPSIAWVLASVSTNEITGQITKRGGHFVLGAHEADKLHGLMILKQDGVSFALAMPKEAEGLDVLEIDYAGDDFFISN
ncbi:hypothetical protein B5K11_05370 [Rhizobium leguminosarum bv. trifolii]|uniref:hypothetical protein n=1 Tax=Rhizobium leguminosarum TaxID=384 RepID=UPI000E2EDED0|nr:hypothetical protein [Rhizobium leguminosarum]RFB97321.1 hypothetical protein B5K11_05370 [Rhizobium leguminosarum bv. trifolii]